MPNLTRYEIMEIFSEAKKVLLPNGKIFVLTEMSQHYRLLMPEIKQLGFSIREKTLIGEEIYHYRKYSQMIDEYAKNKALGKDYKLFLIEFTFRLKKAIPGKFARREMQK